MLEALKNAQNQTLTENEAVTFSSTLNHCLDLFATIGALRKAKSSEILQRFSLAFFENAELALKIIFFARDIRQGLGERRVFRIALSWLAYKYPHLVIPNIPLIPEYGRFDDVLVLLNTPCEKEMATYIAKKLDSDLKAAQAKKPISLLSKWLPSINSSSLETQKLAKRVAKLLHFREAKYRTTLSSLRQNLGLIETYLTNKDYSFAYSNKPSRALFKYRAAFLRNDQKRYTDFLTAVAEGQAHLHTGNLWPFDIVHQILNRTQPPSPAELQSLEVSWQALEDYTQGQNALVVMDGSGSMYGSQDPCPADVALSLSIYFAERNVGAFNNHFITFSQNPRLIEIHGANIWEKVNYCRKFDEVANTNLEGVFNLILEAALAKNAKPCELPQSLYIISDMEFDRCTRSSNLTNFENAKTLFEEHGYKLPRVVFWNVESRNRQQPVTQNTQGVILVSGNSPRIFSLITSEKATPLSYMLEILNDKRYAQIKIPKTTY